MVMLVSLEQAKIQVKVDTDADDSRILGIVRGVSRFIVNYLDDDVFELDSNNQPVEDSDGIVIDVPEDVALAALLIIGQNYTDTDAPSFREGDTAPRLGDIIIPRGAHSLLDNYRTPVCR